VGHAGSRTIGITGAAGTIGRVLATGLAESFALRLFDRAGGRDPVAGNAIAQLDLANEADLRGRFDGLDAVIHLAASHRANPPFHEVVANNIVVTHNVLEEACRAGVKRVVFASTNHVQNGYAAADAGDMAAMSETFAASGRLISTNDPPAPDSFYGVSKLCGEDLGRYYALYLKQLTFVALRIGWVAPANPHDAPLAKITRTPDVERHYRALFLSQRDAVVLFTRALIADQVFFVGYGTSANRRPIFDLTATVEGLGYKPLDNSDTYFGALGLPAQG
jgi:nucleoside-diphosphate-sugar epimerase